MRSSTVSATSLLPRRAGNECQHLQSGKSDSNTDGNSHADSYANCHSDGYAYADSHGDGYAYTDSYGNGHSNGYAYADSHANCDSNSYAYPDAYAYVDGYGPAETKPNPKAISDAAASSVEVTPKRLCWNSRENLASSQPWVD